MYRDELNIDGGKHVLAIVANEATELRSEVASEADL